MKYLSLICKGPICTLFAWCSKCYRWNIDPMPVAKINARVDHNPICLFLDGNFLSICLVVGLLLSAMPAAAKPEPFEAAIQLGAAGTQKQGQVYASQGVYRLDIQDNDHPVQLIVDITAGTVHLLEPHHKRYRTVESRSYENLVVNPIDAFRLTSGFYPRQNAGREVIQGFECDKLVYLSNGQPLMTAWVSTRLELPLKAVNHRFPEMSFELSDIRGAPVNTELLTVPANFDDVSATPSSSAPPTSETAIDKPLNEWMVKAGERQLLEIAEGQGISIKVVDDAADGRQTKGKIVFYRRADPPLERFESRFRMPNGRSQEVVYPASAMLRAVEFQVEQGAIRIHLEPPP